MQPLTFTDKKLVAELTSKMLFEIEAVHFTSGKPFVFTSGTASPVYIDCRKLISFPRVRSTLMDFGASLLALHDLLVSKEFCLVAIESSGSNAFFVKKEFAKHFEILSPVKSWRPGGRFDTESDKQRMKENVKNSKFIEI